MRDFRHVVRSIREERFSDARAALLPVIWELPREVPLALAADMLERALSFYEAAAPSSAGLRELLMNRDAWGSQECAVDFHFADEEGATHAAVHFEDGILAFLDALRYPDQSGAFVTGCEQAVSSAISAHAEGAAAAADPEAYRALLRHDRAEGRALVEGTEPGDLSRDDMAMVERARNSLVRRTVEKGEWNAVIVWLAREGVDQYADVVDTEGLAKVLEQWERQEGERILPRRRQ